MYNNGLIEAGDRLCAEGHVALSGDFRARYAELGEIRKELRQKKLDKALDWASRNSPVLAKLDSDTPFTLHKLQV